MAVVVIVMNFFLQGLLNQLLSFISSLSFIIHMFLITLNYPVEILEFFSMIFPLITFDVFPTDKLYEKMFGLSQIKNDFPLTD